MVFPDKGSPIIDLTQDSDTVKEKSKAPKHVMTPEEREVMIEQMKAKKEEERKRRLLEREEEKRKRQLEREEEKQRKKTEKEKVRFLHCFVGILVDEHAKDLFIKY